MQNQRMTNNENWVYQGATPCSLAQHVELNRVNNPPTSGTPMNDQSFVTGSPNVPETLTNNAFLPAYLISNIGNWARISLLVGDDIVDVVGELWMVGATYVIVKTLEPNTTIMVDLFSIKMVTIIYDENLEKLVNR